MHVFPQNRVAISFVWIQVPLTVDPFSDQTSLSTLFFGIVIALYAVYKQNKGRTNRNGNSNGTKSKEVPQVQVLLRMSVKMIIMIDIETMKHPPRLRYCTKTVDPSLTIMAPSQDRGLPPTSKK